MRFGKDIKAYFTHCNYNNEWARNMIDRLCVFVSGYKNHRNGIKKPQRFRSPSMKGVSVYCRFHSLMICLIFSNIDSNGLYCLLCSL